jgi:hypothetical protein
MNYLEHWASLYVVHLGVWVTFGFICSIHKNGLPEVKKLPSLFKSAIVVSLVLAIFSSHSHTHYLEFLK